MYGIPFALQSPTVIRSTGSSVYSALYHFVIESYSADRGVRSPKGIGYLQCVTLSDYLKSKILLVKILIWKIALFCIGAGQEFAKKLIKNPICQKLNLPEIQFDQQVTWSKQLRKWAALTRFIANNRVSWSGVLNGQKDFLTENG